MHEKQPEMGEIRIVFIPFGGAQAYLSHFSVCPEAYIPYF
jgi:hypothetical protein